MRLGVALLTVMQHFVDLLHVAGNFLSTVLQHGSGPQAPALLRGLTRFPLVKGAPYRITRARYSNADCVWNQLTILSDTIR